MAENDHTRLPIADEAPAFEPVDHGPQHDLAALVSLNEVIAALAGRDPGAVFLRESIFDAMFSELGAGAAHDVFDAIVKCKLGPLVQVAHEGDETTQCEMLDPVVSKSYADFVERIALWAHPTRTLHVKRAVAVALWPSLQPRKPTPVEFNACLQRLGPLQPNDVKAIAWLRGVYWWLDFPDKCLRGKTWPGKRGQGERGPDKGKRAAPKGAV